MNIKNKNYLNLSGYTFGDSGLAYEMKKIQKLNFFKEKAEIEEEIESKMKNFVNYPEYQSIKDEDRIITIEYW